MMYNKTKLYLIASLLFSINVYGANNSNDNQMNEAFKMLDEVNKKKIEYEIEKDKNEEKRRESDKDYIIEELKKDDKIDSLKLKILSYKEQMLKKENDLNLLNDTEKEKYISYAEVIISYIDTLKDSINTSYTIISKKNSCSFGNKTIYYVDSNTLYDGIIYLENQKILLDKLEATKEYYKRYKSKESEAFLKYFSKPLELLKILNFKEPDNFEKDTLIMIKTDDVFNKNIIVSDMSNDWIELKLKGI